MPVPDFQTMVLPRLTMQKPEFVNAPDRVTNYLINGGVVHTIRASKGQGRDFQRACSLITAEVVTEIAQDCARFSVDFIKQAAKDKRPFFYERAFVKTHYDNILAKRYRNKSFKQADPG